ncbi:MFS transporter [Thermodesulfobacteriota bacterium]
MSMERIQPRERFFYGYWVLFACFFFSVYTGGAVFYGFTAIFEPIAEECGWSYTQISLAASLRGLEMGLLAPLLGILVDRWGARPLMIGGSIVAGIGLIFLSKISTLVMFYMAFVIIAIGMSPAGSTVQMAATANWFNRRLGFATSIVSSGYAAGGFLIPLIVLAVDTYGWRTVMFGVGVGFWIVGLPLSFLVRHKPEQYGYLPDGDTVAPVVNPADAPPGTKGEKIPIHKLLLSPTFWFLVFAPMINQLIFAALVTHVMPYLSSINVERSLASLVAGGLPLTGITGRLIYGWLADRFPKRIVAATASFLMSLSMLTFHYSSIYGIWLLIIFLIFIGLGWGGTITLRVVLMHEYFGREQFGTIMGLSAGLMMLGSIAGPPVSGWVFDSIGSYQLVWLTFSGLALISCGLFFTIPPIHKTISVQE